MQGKCVLAITSNIGIQIWSMHGDHMIFYFPLDSSTIGVLSGDDTANDSHFMRGVTTFLDYLLCVGCSTGNILIFNCKDRESSNFNVIHTIDTLDKTPISSLTSNASNLICGNDSGKIVGYSCSMTGSSNVIFEKIFSFLGYGSPCTSLICTEYLFCASYATGHLRIFRFDVKEMV